MANMFGVVPQSGDQSSQKAMQIFPVPSAQALEITNVIQGSVEETQQSNK